MPENEGPLRISHIISGLSAGGAEMMLFRLLSHMDGAAFESRVVSLTDIGEAGEMIQALGVPVHELGMRRGLPNPLRFLRLLRWLRQGSADVVQTWMYNSDLIGGVAARLAGNARVVWNIRHTDFGPGDWKGTAYWSAKACVPLSRTIPTSIICCSQASKTVHARLGYAVDKMLVIPNGFDLRTFRPDPAARRSMRRELGLPDGALLIGLIARFHAQKDHRNFIQAASQLAAQLPDAHFLLCGEGITWENRTLAGWIEASGIRDRYHVLGPRNDISRVDAALDVATSSAAYGEGFPNIIGEAMACGVPCAVTDVGDSALIVGDTGRVVPPREPEALAAAWRALVDAGAEGRVRLGAAARRRIQEKFDLLVVVAQYERLYAELSSDVASVSAA